jgi:hypothetical protein
MTQEEINRRVDALFSARWNPQGRSGVITPDMQVLGLKPGFTQADVEKAARRLIRANHPDVGGSEDRLRRILAARERLAR